MEDDFEQWWNQEGRLISPIGNGLLERVKKIARIAWENGAFKATENERKCYE